MPARKRGRVGVPKASSPLQDDGSIAVDAPETEEPMKKSAQDPLNDLWTDEQETSLFKGIIRWKPAGMHKHFRMIAISEYLRNHGYDPKVDLHTRIPGIWQKLGTLYNLEIIDERENSFDYGDDETIEQKYLEFSLPDEEFGKMKWDSGMAPSNTSSSPPRLNDSSEIPEPPKKRKRADTVTASKTRASTIEDTDEAKLSPAPSQVVKATRASRGAKRSSSRLKGEASEQQASKETTVDEVDEDVDMDEKTDVVEEDQEDEDDGEEGTPSPNPKNVAKVGKGSAPTRAQGRMRKATRRK